MHTMGVHYTELSKNKEYSQTSISFKLHTQMLMGPSRAYLPKVKYIVINDVKALNNFYIAFKYEKPSTT